MMVEADLKRMGEGVRCLDVSCAEREFGFRAEASFQEGLRRTIEWYRLR
jgi:GDP-L-fucose synthase